MMIVDFDDLSHHCAGTEDGAQDEFEDRFLEARQPGPGTASFKLPVVN